VYSAIRLVAGWWVAAERAVASVGVVVLEPGGKGGFSLGVGGEDLPVGPFAGEGAVEAFDFAVLLWAVGPDEDVSGAEFGDDHAPIPSVTRINGAKSATLTPYIQARRRSRRLDAPLANAVVTLL
jgi:hypothetical protein